MLADKSSVSANYCGDGILHLANADIHLKRVLYILEMGYNLVSTGRLVDKGIESHFGRTEVRLVLESNNFFHGPGPRVAISGMFTLNEPIMHIV